MKYGLFFAWSSTHFIPFSTMKYHNITKKWIGSSASFTHFWKTILSNKHEILAISLWIIKFKWPNIFGYVYRGKTHVLTMVAFFWTYFIRFSMMKSTKKTDNSMNTTIIQGRRIGTVFEGQKRNLTWTRKEVFTRKTNFFDTHGEISAAVGLSLYNIYNILKYQSFLNHFLSTSRIISKKPLCGLAFHCISF